MNILVSTWSLQIGGAEIFIVNFTKELSAKKHNIYVFVESNFVNHDLLLRLRADRIKILSFNNLWFFSFIAWKLNALFNLLGFKINIYKEITNFYFFLCIIYYRIDIISSHSAYSDASKIKRIEKSNIKIVFTDHGECAAWAAKGDFFFKDFLTLTTAVVSVSKNGVKFLSSNSLIDTSKLHLIYNGVLPRPIESLTNVKRDLKIEENAFVFGMLGRNSMQKGWDIAIQAFQLLLKTTTRKDIHLVLIGVSKDLLESTGLNDFDERIHFIEPTNSPGSYIGVMNVGLIPSCYYEELPTVAIEFLYAHKPVIASNLGGIPEIVLFDANSSAGTLIELTSELRPKADILAAAMNTYLKDDQVLQNHIACTTLAVKKFDMSVCVNHYESLFYKVLNQ